VDAVNDYEKDKEEREYVKILESIFSGNDLRRK
jgi:hypothetical protein